MLRRILLVEDDITLRGIFWMVLVEAGYAVLEAETGRQALALLGPAADRVDLLITDNRMPGGASGADLMRMARERRPDLPIIGLTGAMPDPDVMTDPALNGVVWLSKPILPQALLARTEALVGPGR